MKKTAAVTPGNTNWLIAGICGALVAVTFIIYWQTFYNGFVNYDDDDYVYNNPIITRGLSVDGIVWAFTHVHASNWHPITTLSHMLDCQLYGLHPGWHHLTNVFLHAACAVLLFLMLRSLTGALWRSAFVAALFAVHPLRVESVAWISERKDVLSGFFFMLTLWAWSSYARRPSRGRYALVAMWLALGLMSKPMLVTLPCVLLLLDYWPLGRFRSAAQLPGLLWEKIPFFALSVLSCAATIFAQKESIQPDEHVGLLLRVSNALVAYVVYIGKLIYPSGLAVLYPFLTGGWKTWQVIGAALILGALTAGAYLTRLKRPYLIVGWFWYVGMLVPVIGLLQVGQQAYADRYTYLPEIGLCIAGTWAAADLLEKLKYARFALTGAAAAVLLVFMIAAFKQTGFWRDSEILWTHAIECTDGNYGAQNNLGLALAGRGRTEEAIAHYQQAIDINPSYAKAQVNLGTALVGIGQTDEAIAHYQEALRLNPALPAAHLNLGYALARLGRNDEALAQYNQVLRLNPSSAKAHNNIGNVLLAERQPAGAIAEYRKALQIDPGYLEAQFNLSIVLAQQGQAAQAIGEMDKALKLQPSNLMVINNLAWLLATVPQTSLRDGPRAVQLAAEASRMPGGNDPNVLRTMAAAYAASGQYTLAEQTGEQALQMAEAHSDAALADTLRREIALYNSGHGFENP